MVSIIPETRRRHQGPARVVLLDRKLRPIAVEQVLTGLLLMMMFG